MIKAVPTQDAKEEWGRDVQVRPDFPPDRSVLKGVQSAVREAASGFNCVRVLGSGHGRLFDRVVASIETEWSAQTVANRFGVMVRRRYK
jgi:hypothetical protein